MSTRISYEIVPVTLIVTPDGRVLHTECEDDQAMEWYIYAAVADHERKLILHATSRAIADEVVGALEQLADR